MKFHRMTLNWQIRVLFQAHFGVGISLFSGQHRTMVACSLGYGYPSCLPSLKRQITTMFEIKVSKVRMLT